MSAPIAPLPVARLMHPIALPEEEQPWPALVLLARDSLTRAGRLSARLADAGWQVSLRYEEEFLDLIAVKGHLTIAAAVAELRAVGASGCVYLDAPDRSSTVQSATLAVASDPAAGDVPSRG